MLRRVIAAALLLAMPAIAAAQGATTPKGDSAATAPPHAPVDTAMATAVRQLLVATGTRQNLDMMMDQMMVLYEKRFPSVPTEFWTEFRKQMNDDEMIALVVPIYAKYLSIDDVRAATAFYESPAGKRVVAALPQIMKESMQVGAAWGEAAGRRIMDQLKQKGYVKST
jgi:uncharacterized protein